MITTLDYANWLAEGKLRFGGDLMDFTFVCPVCQYEQSARECIEAGMESGAIGFSCIGRWLPPEQIKKGPPGPCHYAGGGLFKLNPIRVRMPDGTELPMFAFAAKAKQ